MNLTFSIPLRLAGVFLIAVGAGCDSDKNMEPKNRAIPLGVSHSDARTAEDCGVPESTIQSLASKVPGNELAGMDYPWEGLEQEIRKAGNTAFDLIGYGSLLNPDSARRTIKDTPENGHPPVLAMGATRVFDYVMPPSMILDHPQKFDPQMKAALNLRYTPDSRSLFNGRLLKVRIEDIEGLRSRERGYDLRPVVYIPWGKWNAEPKSAYVLVARQQTIDGRQLLDETAEPFPPYEKTCREGAALVSISFLEFYTRTTYIGKDLMPLSDYLNKPK